MTEYRHKPAPAQNQSYLPSTAESDGNLPPQQPIGEQSKCFQALRANHFGSQSSQMLTKHVCRAKTTEVAGLDVSNAHLGRIT